MPGGGDDKKKVLYDAVSKDYDLGTYDEFSKKLDDPTKRKTFFYGIGHEYDLGDFDTFNKKLGYDSKEVQQQSMPMLDVNNLQSLQLPHTQQSEGEAIYAQIDKRDKAVRNTIQRQNELSNKQTDVNSPEYKQQFDNLIEQQKNNDRVIVNARDGKPFLVPASGFWENAGNSFMESIKAPVNAVRQMTMNDKKLQEYFDKRERKQPYLPKDAPSPIGGLGGIVGGIPKIAAELSIPYVGEALAVAETELSSTGAHAEELYHRRLDELADDKIKKLMSTGLSEEEAKNQIAITPEEKENAASQARKDAPLAALPDAAMILALNRIGGNPAKLNTSAQTFAQTLKQYGSQIGKVSALGGVSESARSGIEALQGYNVTPEEAVKKFGEGAYTWGLMDAMFKVAPLVGKGVLPKVAEAQLKDYVSQVPKPIFEKAISEMGEQGDQLKKEVEQYAEAKKIVHPEEETEITETKTPQDVTTITEEEPKEKQAEVIQPETTTGNQPSNADVTTVETGKEQENVGENIQPQPTDEEINNNFQENILPLQTNESAVQNIEQGQNKSDANNIKPLDEKSIKEKFTGIDEAEIVSPYDKVLHYFANDGKIHSSAINDLFGGKDKRLRISASVEGERKSRIGLIGKDSPGIDALAHKLWEADTTGKYDTQDYREAIEQVLMSYNGKLAMAKDLVEKYDYETAYQKHLQQHGKEFKDVYDNLQDDDINHILQLDADGNRQQELEDYIDNLQSQKDNSVVENKTEENQKEEPLTNNTTQEPPPSEPPSEPPLSTTIHAENPKTILTHKGLQEIATEIDGEDVTPRERESRLAQLKEADNTISEWQANGAYDKNINDITDRAKKGHIDEIEQKILANHLATLREERRAIPDKNSKAFKDKTAEVAKVIDAAKTMRSKAGGLLGDKAFGSSIPKDYSNPISVQESVEHVTGEPINADQEKKIKELTDQNQQLKKQADDLEKKLIEATNENIGKERGKKTYTEKAKNVADRFRKLKSKPFTFKDENGNEIKFKTQGITWNDLVELGAKAIEKTGEIADGVAAIIEKVKDADWYAKLSANDKQKFEEQLQQHYEGSVKETPEAKKIKALEKERDDLLEGKAKQKSGKSNYDFTDEEKQHVQDLDDEIADLKERMGLVKSKAEKPLTEEEQRQQDEKELSELQKQFENKKSTDKKFTTEQAKDLWDYAKKNYLNKGVGLFDAMKQTGLDTGLTFEQVNAAFKTSKTKPITDAAWLKQYQLRKNKASIDNFIENSNRSPLVKTWKAITRIPKAVTTAIHGHVFPGTHYSMGFLTPQDWGIYFKSYAVSAKNAYGSDAFHEQEIQRITNNKNYPIARRAGLANDVERTDTDDFENAPKIFGKIGKTGTKGFLGLKDLRQNLFDRYWDALPEDEKTDKTAEAIAYLTNSATLASNIKIPAFAKEGLFSAGMESARWGKIFKNPTMAAAAAARITAALLNGAEIRPEDKIFVKIWGSRVGQQLATMTGLLTLNAFIQSKVNPKNPVNLTDPTQSDYLNFKVGDQTVDLSGGVLGIKNFLLPITQYAVKDKSYKKEMGDIGGKVLQYGRNKLSPFYGDVADVAFGTDWAGNPTPFSNKTPSAGKHTLMWSEYLSEKAPIFASDALQNMFASAEENGLPKTKAEKIVNQIINVGLTGGLGLHNHPSYQAQTPFTEEDKKDPTFKYFIDKGMSLPNVSDNYTIIKDKSTHTEKPLSEFPQEKQDQYNKVHKQFLKKELQQVKTRSYVYIDDYKKIAIEYSEGHKRIPLSKLNTEQLAQVLHLAQISATKKSKLKIFGTD